MKKLLTTAALACSLYADSKIEGPKLGYISTSVGIRTVLGIVGASRLSAPITPTNGVVLPGQDVAFATDSGGRLLRIDLAAASSADVGLADVTRVVASSSGEAIAAVTNAGITVVAKDGSRGAELNLPGSSRLLAISDTGNTAAVTVAEGEEEALYISNPESSRRVFASAKIPAIAFIPNTSDLVLANESGAVYRLNADLQLTQLGEAAGVSALAVVRDRVIAVAGRTVRAIPIAGGETTSLECSCEASIANPLGDYKFLLTQEDHGPMWVLDASGAELRLAFIPEAVNE